MKIRYLLILTLLLQCVALPNPTRAQREFPDSALMLRYLHMHDSKAKVDSLLKMSKEYRRKADVAPLLSEALRAANKVGYDQVKCQIIDLQGVNMRDQSQYSKAIDLHNQALGLAKKQKDIKNQIVALNNLGVVYRRLDEFAHALDYHFEALKLAEQISDDYSVSVALNSIGNIHISMGNYQDAISYFNRSLAISEQANNNVGIAMNLNNIGEAYEFMGVLDSAEYYYKESLLFNKAVGIKKGEAICYNSLGNVMKKVSKLDDAIYLFTKALSINKELNDRIFIADSYINLGLAFLAKKQFSQAEKNLLEGLKIANNIGSKTEQKEAYMGLMSLHEQTKDFSMALGYGKMYKVYADSIVNEKNSRHVAQMEAIYATEKKEIKITALEKEQRLSFWLGIAGGTVLLLALAYFIVQQRLAVSKKKLAEQQVKQLKQEQQLMATQAILDGETAERTRLARDLHDGLGGMLSAVKLNLSDVKNRCLVTENAERFTYALSMIDEAIRELRRVAHHMMPESLVRYGLKSSITDFCNAISSVHFHFFGNEQRLDSKFEILIYRSAHELVNNALKHANATQINVQLVQEKDRVSLTVQDNGKGFDPANSTEGMGLKNIRNRVDTYCGKINLYSSPGNGTEVNIEFDINNQVPL